MARHVIGHLLSLSVFLCTTYFSRQCMACDKHKHHGQSHKADDCLPEGKDTAGPEGQATQGTAASALLRGSPTEEGRLTMLLKSTNIQKQLTDVVPRAVKHLEAQDLLPPLQDIETLARDLLMKTGKGLLKPQKKGVEDEISAVVINVLRLISAVKAVRAGITCLEGAWFQLREAIHKLAELEKSTISSSEGAVLALINFLEADLWMTTTTDSVHSASKQLKDVLTDKVVSGTLTAEEKGDKLVEEVLTRLEHF